MFKIRPDGLIVDADDDQLVGVSVDSFATALGVESQSQIVIFRLYAKSWPAAGGLVPRDRAHQFALTAPRAAELGRQLLELAAQAEKETGKTSH